MKVSSFWYIIQWSPMKVNRCFWGIYHIHLQGWGVSQAWSHPKSEPAGFMLFCCSIYDLLRSGFLASLHFGPEDGGDMFLQNVGWLSADYMVQYRRSFKPRSGHVGFVEDKVALGQVSSEYFGFPWQFSFHRLLQTHHLSIGAVTKGQLVADVANELSLTPPQETKKKKLYPTIQKSS
jgi:hypothetical protein